MNYENSGNLSLVEETNCISHELGNVTMLLLIEASEAINTAALLQDDNQMITSRIFRTIDNSFSPCPNYSLALADYSQELKMAPILFERALQAISEFRAVVNKFLDNSFLWSVGRKIADCREWQVGL